LTHLAIKRHTDFMNISLTPELEEFVTKKVDSGLYQTASEVVREGLRLLRERDDVQRAKLEQLKKEFAVGLDEAKQGKTVPFTEETIEGVKARRRSWRHSNGPAKPRAN
jgi:antitoxin ParD1/3/4